jgi:hypothetical protein
VKRRVTFAVGGLLLALAVVGMIWRSAWLNADPPKIGVRFAGFTTNADSNIFLVLRLTNGTAKAVYYGAPLIKWQSDSGTWTELPRMPERIIDRDIEVGSEQTLSLFVPAANRKYQVNLQCLEHASMLVKWFNRVVWVIHEKLGLSSIRFSRGRTYSVQVTIPPP